MLSLAVSSNGGRDRRTRRERALDNRQRVIHAILPRSDCAWEQGGWYGYLEDDPTQDFAAAGIMSGADYRKTFKTARFTRSIATVAGFSVDYSDRYGFMHSVIEIFQDETYKFIASRPNPIIVDVGANIGLSVLYFKKHYPEARIMAFEPDPSIFELLLWNIKKNDLKDIYPQRVAAWDKDTFLTFYAEGALAGSTEVNFDGKAQTMEVAAKRLKSLLPKEPIDFLKIDIEGAETIVLRDIADELERVEHLFFEYHSAKGKPQTLSKLLSIVGRAGFRYTITSQHASSDPFIRDAEYGFDMQLNVFCYRRSTR